MNLEQIAEKEQKLNQVKLYLKEQFIGIDNIIDQFIDSVKVWYIVPELQLKPLIINLWGITGVAKTDLVRKFVKAIEFTDRFAEIQLDSKEGEHKIENYLDNIFDMDTHGVLLLDEIQRFRTINNDGNDNNSSKYQDIWMLLSDGTFQSNSTAKRDLMEMIIEDRFYTERLDKSSNDKTKDLIYHSHYWTATRIKKLLKCPETIEDIMKWTGDEKIAKLKSNINNSDLYEGKKYSKLLIIIAGNLDEAYYMAGNVNDADSDADVYHEFSKTININNIKKALTSRFKPEQIARFGNIHLIYTIPNRDTYERIIEQKTKIFIDLIKSTYSININISSNIKDVIYKNGVYPAQGIRPLLSTISAIFENSIPNFLYEYLKAKSTGDLNLDFIDGHIVSTINDKLIKYKVPTVLDDIKNKQTIDNKTLIAGHEAGHAVLYAILFGTVPTQIVCTTTGTSAEGFIGTHKLTNTRKQILDSIQVAYAGRIAEFLLFGNDNITSGASADYKYATRLASQYIRHVGMGHVIGTIRPTIDAPYDYINDTNKYDDDVELLLKESYEKAYTLLEENLAFLKATTLELIKKSVLKPEEFQEICKTHLNKTLPLINPTETIEPDFNAIFNKTILEEYVCK